MARRLPDALALTRAELDVSDPAAVRALPRAEVIINCAVAGVAESGEDPARAEAVNVRGPALLAERCDRLVHFGTNYVDGVYGRTKRAGERFAATVIRTSWVFGEGKDNFFSAVHRRLRRGERVRAARDVVSTVTWVEDLAERAAQITAAGVHEIANGGLCSPFEFALEAARLVGADPSLVEAVSDPRLAPPLAADPPLRHWRDALAEYIIRAP